MRTVSDTSPVSNLAIIGQINLLREQFDKVSIPQAVFNQTNRIAHTSIELSKTRARFFIALELEKGILAEAGESR
jgi:predicted nucleic acid-binding protein